MTANLETYWVDLLIEEGVTIDLGKIRTTREAEEEELVLVVLLVLIKVMQVLIKKKLSSSQIMMHLLQLNSSFN